MILPIKMGRLGRVSLFSALIVIQLIFVPLTLGTGSHENKEAHKHTNSQPAKDATGNMHEKQHGTGTGHEKHPHHTDPVNAPNSQPAKHETGNGHKKHHTDSANTPLEHTTRDEGIVQSQHGKCKNEVINNTNQLDQ